jgi:hypothetical protein
MTQRLREITMDNPVSVETVMTHAQPVLDAFYDAVVNCGRKPPFKPTIRISSTSGATLYDHDSRAVVLTPYEILPPARRAVMDRFASIGTLGLSGREQYSEVFNNLLVAHELGHWLQEISRRPLNRWQAEYEANRIMVAFWRENPGKAQAASTEDRLANFVVQAATSASPMPDDAHSSIEEYFNTHVADIESNPVSYAGFQKLMVRQAIAEHPVPTFCDLVAAAWQQ